LGFFTLPKQALHRHCKLSLWFLSLQKSLTGFMNPHLVQCLKPSFHFPLLPLRLYLFLFIFFKNIFPSVFYLNAGARIERAPQHAEEESPLSPKEGADDSRRILANLSILIADQ